jgi:hypothetical protein
MRAIDVSVMDVVKSVDSQGRAPIVFEPMTSFEKVPCDFAA